MFTKLRLPLFTDSPTVRSETEHPIETPPRTLATPVYTGQEWNESQLRQAPQPFVPEEFLSRLKTFESSLKD